MIEELRSYPETPYYLFWGWGKSSSEMALKQEELQIQQRFPFQVLYLWREKRTSFASLCFPLESLVIWINVFSLLRVVEKLLFDTYRIKLNIQRTLVLNVADTSAGFHIVLPRGVYTWRMLESKIYLKSFVVYAVGYKWKLLNFHVSGGTEKINFSENMF